MKYLFERITFLVFFISLITFLIIGISVGFETTGINKTIGWTLDINNLWVLNAYAISFITPLTLIVYGILNFIKIKLSFSLSLLHYLSFCTILIIYQFSFSTHKIIFVLNLITSISFISNLRYAIKNRNTLN